MEALSAAFYRNLFKAQEVTTLEVVSRYIPRKVSDCMNESLTTEFSSEEVKRAVFMMHPNKSLGPGGFTTGFYQRHWELVGPDISTAALSFLNSGEMAEVVNSTIPILIPKVKDPQDLTHFRPISLCNVLYKIYSKVIANRLRTVLNELISEEQSAFVPGRLITDNVLVAYECIHYLKQKKGKVGACAVKLDMAKAYDRVEWSYLQAVLSKMGCHDSFVQLIMKCVLIVSFRVRVNGKLRHFYADSGYSSRRSTITLPLPVVCRGTLVSHLLFADDCLIFKQASERGGQRLMEILLQYRRGSDQLVNMTKSAIFFSKNCGDTDKERMKNVTGIQNEALCEKYLGLSTTVGRSTKNCFEAIPTKICGLMNGWGEKQLSCAARETLIKSVAQAVPTYSMSCFILAPTTCQKIKTATSNYRWSSGVDKRGLHWRNWPDMCVPKAEGGLGFRDTKLFNIAMLGKQGWRLMVNPESLCARVLKGKYYHSKDFMTATKKKNASHTWCAILAGRKVLRMGCIKRIGDGQSTNIWKDQWIPGGIGMKPVRRMEGATTEQVCDLLSPDGRSWDENALNQNLTPLDAAAVRQIPLGRSLQDIWAWSGERHGLYTVRSGYRLLASAAAQHRSYVQSRVAHSNHLNDPLWQKFWKCKVPPKVRVFWWPILNEYIPSRSNLHRRHIDPLSIL
jgi:hypothetical protein